MKCGKPIRIALHGLMACCVATLLGRTASTVTFLLLLRTQFSAAQVFDGRCWRHAAEADQAACSMEDPCRSDCWSSIFTHSYCCIEHSNCWHWGQAAVGDPVRTDLARSGVECRYLCQAQPGCSVWTFHLPPGGSGPDDFGPCLLHGGPDVDSFHEPMTSRSAVVSGPRICTAAADSKGGSAHTPLPEVALSPSHTLLHDWGDNFVFHTDRDGYAQGVADALVSYGFAVLRGVLSPQRVAVLAKAVAKQADELLKLDPSRMGNRGPRRYSFGGASHTHHMVHDAAWAELMDVPALKPVLLSAFKGSYVAVGGGGDFVLGETDTNQRLHVDLQLPEMYSKSSPPAAIVANFAVSNVTCQDGPMRVLPRTQLMPLAVAEEATNGETFARMSSLEKEPFLQHRLGLRSVLACPLEPGDVMLRDMRLWHGGTPNVGTNVRFLPSTEFLSEWYAEATAGTDDHFEPRPALPFEHWAKMSEHGRQVTRKVLSVPGPVRGTFKIPFVLLLPYVAEDRA